MKDTKTFKPYIGRCFELKNFTEMKKYPPIVLVMDENKKEVMFLDANGNATWISKYYLRDKPLESRVFSGPDTLARTITFIDLLRTSMVEGPFAQDKKKSSELNKMCAVLFQELRDLSNRIGSVEFAPPLPNQTDDGTQDFSSYDDASTNS